MSGPRADEARGKGWVMRVGSGCSGSWRGLDLWAGALFIRAWYVFMSSVSRYSLLNLYVN